ncbi:MAG: hypothetical protein LBJ78_02240 [Puniceicoccales bacterium]|nr:hypothetical protein [Puniceicoccales bacterium]
MLPDRLDSNNNVHLLTKREFMGTDGNSFDSLTDCSRFLFMDVKNGHLWLVFFNVDRDVYWTVCILAQDIIDHAI